MTGTLSAAQPHADLGSQIDVNYAVAVVVTRLNVEPRHARTCIWAGGLCPPGPGQMS